MVAQILTKINWLYEKLVPFGSDPFFPLTPFSALLFPLYYTKPRHKFRLLVDQNLIDFLLLQTPC